MLPRPRGIPFSQISRAAWLVGIFLLLTPANLLAEQTDRNVVCREGLSPGHRAELAAKLRRITGLPELKFDNEGTLFLGSSAPVGGSESARELLANANSGRNLIVIEEVSSRAEVAFCRVVPGRWKKDVVSSPPAFVIQIDFADFDQVVGDERALEAFNVGWGLLHELDHIVNDSPDAASLGETGECEANINQMRRECNLPLRADYFYTLLPLSRDSVFTTRFVRLAFEQQQLHTKKKKRYWVVWDANVVGGLEQNQVAALR
jgi:hypothetical protein